VTLAEEGLVTLDAPVPLALPNHGVTLAQLLSHLGGLASEAGDLGRFGDGDDALDRAGDELAGLPPLVAPGEAWSYSNAGYWAAGLLCAKAAGVTYEAALSSRVLEPFGLAATHFGAPDARGHLQPEPGLPRHQPAPPDSYARARRPGGGLVSTAPDLLRFAAAHLADERLARMREPRAATPFGAYGLGWQLERIGGLDVCSHLGSTGGFQTVLALVPAEDVAFAVLTNGTGGDAVIREVSNALLDELCGVRREPPPTAALEPRELAALAGRYANADLEATVAVDGSGLAVDAVAIDPSGGRTAIPRFDARPIGGRTFAVVDGQREGDRFDFLPKEGPPRFARIGWWLLPRC
jgi:CubicO group peptidase (beta-lactamase class C family)